MAAVAQEQEMTSLGIRSDLELNRHRQVSEAVGKEIADREVRANLAAYAKEFLQDIPVGDIHPYFHFGNELYSQDIKDPLFNIKSQIDNRERDGLTFKGFENFEQLINNSESDDEVFVWYSPAGRGGNTPPFDKLFFDSGRLYLAFKQDGNKSNHIDIKVDESRFPVVEFLDHVNQYNGRYRPVTQDNDQQAKYHYLEHPTMTGANTSEFFAIVNDFLESRPSRGQEVAYVTRRESADPQPHTLASLFAQVQEQVVQEISKDSHGRIQDEFFDKDFMPTRQEDIRELYYRQIAGYMLKTGQDTVTLYGCSTTSTVSKNSMFRSYADQLLAQFGAGSFMSLYSTDMRLLSLKAKSFAELLEELSNEKYPFDQPGQCQLCHKKHNEVGLLGPCLICRNCDPTQQSQTGGMFGSFSLN